MDTAPTKRSIHQFSESLLAEGEAVFHGGSSLPIQDSVKVKVLGADPVVTKDEVVKKEGKKKAKEAQDGKDFRDGKEAKGGKSDAQRKQRRSQADLRGEASLQILPFGVWLQEGTEILLSARVEGDFQDGRMLELRIVTTHESGLSCERNSACEKGGSG